MPNARSDVLRVALPVPLRRVFEYLAPPGRAHPAPGTRIHVPFGRSRSRIGIVLGATAEPEIQRARMKTAGAALDAEPLFTDADLTLLLWAGDYYQHPLGEVLFGALPAALRAGRSPQPREQYRWRLTEAGRDGLETRQRLGRRQEALLRLLRQSADGVHEDELRERHAISRATFASLTDRAWIERIAIQAPEAPTAGAPDAIRMNAEQAIAANAVAAALERFHPFLLNGVTGSGKTEVYLDLINRVLARGAQALVLVPEIGLTPQFVDRVRKRTAARVAVLHSSLSETERLEAWRQARSGRAGVVLGTRSAVWTPLRSPGIVIVDEEHDPSYKQQEGFRYSARDVAIMRARNAGVPIILGSATPSMESLHNVRAGRYTELRLPQRAGGAAAPVVRIVDLRHQRLQGALSAPLLEAIERELAAGRQTLLFLNRRGYSPVILCHDCGWTASCDRCNVPLTFHKSANRFLCHHCARDIRLEIRCPECGAPELVEVGHGTERLEEALRSRFPKARLLRIDRDSTRRRGSLERMMETIADGGADILIGTQMLAKGHDFPNLTLVGIVDADRGLFSYDFRAGERMAQLFVQVSGRAGRAARRGMVLIQTHHPEHPLLRSLVEHGYDGFADALLRERRETELPPYAYLALLRAEHYNPEPARRFLDAARKLVERDARNLQIFGPVPAPMERRAGRFRFQLLVQSVSRASLHKALRAHVGELDALRGARDVRWSLDVDPLDLT